MAFLFMFVHLQISNLVEDMEFVDDELFFQCAISVLRMANQPRSRVSVDILVIRALVEDFEHLWKNVLSDDDKKIFKSYMTSEKPLYFIKNKLTAQQVSEIFTEITKETCPFRNAVPKVILVPMETIAATTNLVSWIGDSSKSIMSMSLPSMGFGEKVTKKDKPVQPVVRLAHPVKRQSIIRGNDLPMPSTIEVLPTVKESTSAPPAAPASSEPAKPQGIVFKSATAKPAPTTKPKLQPVFVVNLTRGSPASSSRRPSVNPQGGIDMFPVPASKTRKTTGISMGPPKAAPARIDFRVHNDSVISKLSALIW